MKQCNRFLMHRYCKNRSLAQPFPNTAMLENPLATMFGTVGVVYGLVVPLVFVTIFAVFLITSQLKPGVKARSVAQATYCHIMMGVGLLLMTIAAIPTVASVLGGISYSGSTYFSLLVLFAIGGALYLRHDQWVHSIDSASKLIPALIYLYTIKSIGMLIVTLSGLSIVLTFILGNTESDWWVMPLTALLYGLLLSWCTRSEKSPTPFFQSLPMTTSRAVKDPAIKLEQVKAHPKPVSKKKASGKKPAKRKKK